jgi:tetratricopeptide (TPR) repeat protein
MSVDWLSFAYAALIALSLLGVDAVVHSGTVVTEVAVAPQMSRLTTPSVDAATLQSEFDGQLNAIATMPSLSAPEIIRSSNENGVAITLAKAVNVEPLARALQAEFVAEPDSARLALFVEGGEVRGLISGQSRGGVNFREVVTPDKDERLVDFVRRCAVIGGSRLAPHRTALYLLNKHAADGDFQSVVGLAERSKAMLAPTPISPDRALFDNVIGIVHLFQNDPKAARLSFDAAIAADPNNAVASLNAAFTDIQLDEYRKAADRMRQLVDGAPPRNNVLLATAYTTWAAARLGMRDPAGAERLLKQALAIYPESATAYQLWSDAKKAGGDSAGSAELRQKALEAAGTFENYPEIATLYFQLAWQDGAPLRRSKFNNPEVMSFH